MAEENNDAGGSKDLDRDLTVREEHDGSAVIIFTNEAPEGDAGTTKKPVVKADEDEEEEKLTAAETAGKTQAEIDEIRDRRRNERQHRKQVRKEREELLTRQLEAERQSRLALEERLNIIEKKSTGTELMNLDSAIKEAEKAHGYWKQQIALAQAQNNGVALADATEKMIMSRQRHGELTGVRNAYVERQAAPASLDPRMLNHAQAWLSENKWYDPNLRDVDSKITRVLDDEVKADGFNPSTPEYWTELTKRAKERLPHHFSNTDRGNQQDDADKPRSRVAGGTRESQTSNGAKGNSFTLSAERVSAMKEAGVWEDPVKRNKQIQQYRNYDRTHSA